ncbi:MAG TPA: hypothetical protein VJY65_10410 [Chloroflexota bacterium]|nr:hypothetical protein [Chloroflexota bacterium]
MSEPRKQYLAVKGFYSLMIRAQKYTMAYRAADAAEALCGPFGMRMDDERERNISQARDMAAYLLALAEHLEHAAGARQSWACCRAEAVGSAADARAVGTTGRRALTVVVPGTSTGTQCRTRGTTREPLRSM